MGLERAPSASAPREVLLMRVVRDWGGERSMGEGGYGEFVPT